VLLAGHINGLVEDSSWHIKHKSQLITWSTLTWKLWKFSDAFTSENRFLDITKNN
jgi:hypothetical protein